MIARILVSAVLACSLGCALPRRVPQLAATATVAQPETRFAVLPVNILGGIAPELTGSTDRMLGRILRYLSVRGHERFLLDETDTQRLWHDSVARVEASESLAHDFRGAIRVFSNELAKSTPFDALVVASLVYRQATLVRGLVKWDGAIRRLPRPEDEAPRVPDSYQGTISALSLHVMVFDPGGTLIFENYGGLDLAHSLSVKPGKEGGLNAKLRETVLGEERLLNEGVELAFEPYVARPRSDRW